MFSLYAYLVYIVIFAVKRQCFKYIYAVCYNVVCAEKKKKETDIDGGGATCNLSTRVDRREDCSHPALPAW